MSLRAVPLIAIPLVLYNILVMLGGSGPPADILATRIFSLPVVTSPGASMPFTWGDALLFVTLIVLFVEIVKATYTTTASLLDHGLSMLVFVVCLIEFLVVPKAATSIFLFITMATLIDVIAGYTIGIRVAKRDLQIGGGE
jgi:hypothetical protein